MSIVRRGGTRAGADARSEAGAGAGPEAGTAVVDGIGAEVGTGAGDRGGRPAGPGPAVDGLSCYTANLVRYLDAQWDGAALLAGSVRLAVRLDPPGGGLAFSHHRRPLHLLPDGTGLAYAAAPAAAYALPALAREARRHGRALAVVDSARLPWSPASGTPHSAPHWLLVDGVAGPVGAHGPVGAAGTHGPVGTAGGHRPVSGGAADGRWHVVDDFTGLLATGAQRPYRGWLTGAQLGAAMTLPPWLPAQRRRNELAFGFPLPVPAGGALWLRRVDRPEPAAELPGRWLAGDARALPALADRLVEAGAGAEAYLDDCWAAAGHRVFAYRWLLARSAPGPARRAALEAAAQRWAALPKALRLAVESARRGRCRPALIRRAIDDLVVHQSGGMP